MDNEQDICESYYLVKKYNIINIVNIYECEQDVRNMLTDYQQHICECSYIVHEYNICAKQEQEV